MVGLSQDACIEEVTLRADTKRTMRKEDPLLEEAIDWASRGSTGCRTLAIIASFGLHTIVYFIVVLWARKRNMHVFGTK